MQKTFSVSVPAEARTVQTKKNGKADVTYTVTNNKSNPARGRVLVAPKDGSDVGWFNVSGSQERDFGAKESQQYKVSVAIPPETPEGVYSFRIDAINVANPQEDFSEGDFISVHWKPTSAAPKQLPKWLIPVCIAAACLVVAIGLIIFFAWPSSNAPTAADHMVSSSHAFAHTFALEDFPFLDADKDDELKTIRIEGQPSEGRLSLSKTPVTINQEIPATDISAGKLICSSNAVASANRIPPAQFKFRVSDGQSYSDQSYTMRVEYVSAAYLGNWVPTEILDEQPMSRLMITRDSGNILIQTWKKKGFKESEDQTLSTPIDDAADGTLSIRIEDTAEFVRIIHFDAPNAGQLIAHGEAGNKATLDSIGTWTEHYGSFVRDSPEACIQQLNNAIEKKNWPSIVYCYTEDLQLLYGWMFVGIYAGLETEEGRDVNALFARHGLDVAKKSKELRTEEKNPQSRDEHLLVAKQLLSSVDSIPSFLADMMKLNDEITGSPTKRVQLVVDIHVEGDTATAKSERGGEWKFKKTDGGWRIDDTGLF